MSQSPMKQFPAQVLLQSDPSDTGDIHHFQRAGLQTWTAQHKYTLLPSLLPTPIPCCNPQWSSHTSLDQSWELHGSLLGTRLPLLMVGSCTAQISWHYVHPTAGLLPEKTASHTVLNGYHWDFSSRILQVAVLADPLAWTQFCWFQGTSTQFLTKPDHITHHNKVTITMSSLVPYMLIPQFKSILTKHGILTEYSKRRVETVFFFRCSTFQIS